MYNPEFIEENNETLKTLVIRGLHLRHASGFGRRMIEDNLSNIPEAWEVLLNNCQTLGDRFKNDFSSFFNNRPGVNFSFDSCYNKSLLGKDIKAQTGKNIYLDRDRKTGGHFNVWAQAKLKSKYKNNWCGISFGYSFEIDLTKKKFTKLFFVSVEGKNNCWEDSFVLTKRNSQTEQMYSSLLDCTMDAIQACLEDDDNKAWNKGTDFNSSLKKLLKGIKDKK